MRILALSSLLLLLSACAVAQPRVLCYSDQEILENSDYIHRIMFIRDDMVQGLVGMFEHSSEAEREELQRLYAILEASMSGIEVSLMSCNRSLAEAWELKRNEILDKISVIQVRMQDRFFEEWDKERAQPKEDVGI